MPLTLIAVGDIMLGEQPLCENFGVKSMIQEKGSGYLFRDVAPLLKEGDIVFGNLECSLACSDADRLQNSFFCAEGAAARWLTEAGFTILSVANNHIMENGQDCFLETVGAIRRHCITPVGIKDEIPILDVKGTRIAFLAYSFIEDGIADVCYNKVRSEEPILADIRAVRPEAEIVVVSLHWGSEYVPFPSPDQIRIGRALVGAGADIVLGGHPHVLQSFEMYHNRPIIYSLGNFVFDQTFVGSTRDSVIAKITVGDSDDSISVDLMPIRINKHNYSPEIIESPDKERMLMAVNETRSLVEETPVSTYEERLGDYDQLNQTYKRPALRSMKKQFVLNFHRYSWSNVSGIISAFITRRAGEQK